MKQIIRKLEAMRNELDAIIKQLATETTEAVPSRSKGRPKTHIFHDWVDRQQLAQCIWQLHHCHFNQRSRLMEVEGEGYGETDFLLSVYCALIKLGLAPSLKHNQINKQYYSFLKDGCHIDLEDKERTFNNHLNKVVRTGYDLHCLNKECLSDHPLPGAMKPEEWDRWQGMLAAAERLLLTDSYVVSLAKKQPSIYGNYKKAILC